jgi:hypothetical protein
MTYQEPVYQYRVMRQLNDAERNPNGDWSLVFSTMDFNDALDELQHQIAIWAKTGDAFKIKNAGVPVEYITRSAW